MPITPRDPLQAIGFRLGTPTGASYVSENLAGLVAARGSDVARDMLAVAEAADMAAAWRLCEALCPGAVFDVAEEDSGVRVTYVSGAVAGTLTLTRSELCEARPAHAVVSALVGLEHRLSLQAAADRLDGLDAGELTAMAIEMLDWAKILHRPGTRVRMGLEGMARRLREPEAVLGFGDGEISPRDVVVALDPVTRNGDLGREIDAVVERLGALAPDGAPRP